MLEYVIFRVAWDRLFQALGPAAFAKLQPSCHKTATLLSCHVRSTWKSPISRRAGRTGWLSVHSYITSIRKRLTTPNWTRKIDEATFDWRSTLPS